MEAGAPRNFYALIWLRWDKYRMTRCFSKEAISNMTHCALGYLLRVRHAPLSIARHFCYTTHMKNKAVTGHSIPPCL